ncbi:MAG: LysR family transcriptional regulator [Litoreibacter sp.]|nr:LysR family transcriptional regulator [Litoreibacter sp.]
MDWRNVPSLSALRAFDAMARHGGFSKAARELNVTHAAIAQHVRSLEAELGQTLVMREGRGMALTEAGRVLADGLQSGFVEIAQGVEATKQFGQDRPLQIATTPSFAENWLMPRIGAFWSEHPEIKVAIVPGYELVDLTRDGFDMAIRYGRGGWSGVEETYLVSAGNVIVATPERAAGIKPGDISALQKQKWLLEPGRREPRVWAAEQGLDLDAADVEEFSANTMVLAATRAGYGFSLQGRALVEADIASGRLVCLFEAEQSELGYYILTRPGQMQDRLRQFCRWLQKSV